MRKRTTNMKKVVGIISILILFSCEEENNASNEFLNQSPTEVKEALIQANKMAMEKESIQIDSYIKRRNLNVTKTGTGLRYLIYKQGNGEQAVNGKMAIVKYEVSLIDGTVCYSTKEKGPEEFKIGKDNVESGLHEGITYMHVGDKAKIIIPSHLAHGLAGDFHKIPVRSTIIYDIELVALK